MSIASTLQRIRTHRSDLAAARRPGDVTAEAQYQAAKRLEAAWLRRLPGITALEIAAGFSRRVLQPVPPPPARKEVIAMPQTRGTNPDLSDSVKKRVMSILKPKKAKKEKAKKRRR